MPLTTGLVTLAAIRQAARQRADQAINGTGTLSTPDPYSQQNVTSPELDGYINTSAAELADLMVTEYGNYYFTADYVFYTNAQTGFQEQYPIPADMLKSIGLEWRQTPGQNLYNVTMRPFNMGERNRYNLAFTLPPPNGYFGTTRYELQAKSVWLKPCPQSAYEVHWNYVPRVEPLVDSASIALNNVVPGSAFTVISTDPSTGILVPITFSAVASGATGTQFNVGSSPTDAASATALAAVMNTVLGQPTGWLSATVTNNEYTGTPTVVSIGLIQPVAVTWFSADATLLLAPRRITGPTAPIILLTGPMTLEGPPSTNVFTFNITPTVTGAIWGPGFLGQGPFSVAITNGTNFTAGATPYLTAVALAAAINANAQLQQFITAQPVQLAGAAGFAGVAIGLLGNGQGASCMMQWTVSTNLITGQAILQPSPIVYGPAGNMSFTNTMTAYNEWQEYVIVDAARKICLKQESYDQADRLMAAKQEQKARIAGTCDNRDQGMARTVTDVYAAGGASSIFGGMSNVGMY